MRMARFLVALVVAGTVAKATDLVDIEKKGTLRVLSISFADVPSFYAVNSFDLDLLEGFARLHHLQIEPIHVPTYGDLIPALLGGKGDIVAGGVTNTPARRKLIDFSAETFPSRMLVMTRKPHAVVQSLDALRSEKKLGTEKGTSWAQATMDAGVPAANVDDSIPLQDLPDALKSGKITAAIFELNVAITAQARDPELQAGMFVGPPGSQAYGVRRGDTGLLKALNEYIENTRHTPSWNRLVVKFFGTSAPEVLKRSSQQ